MKLTKTTVVLATVISAMSISGMANAAIYLKLEGIEGESVVSNVEITASVVDAAPRDAATGQATGRRDAASGLPTGKRTYEPRLSTGKREPATGLPSGRREASKPILTEQKTTAASSVQNNGGTIVVESGAKLRCTVGTKYPSMTIRDDAGPTTRYEGVSVASCDGARVSYDYLKVTMGE